MLREPPELLEVVVFGGAGFSTEPMPREPSLGGIAHDGSLAPRGLVRIATPRDPSPEAALDVVIPGGGRALIALRTRDAVTSVEVRGGPVALWVLADKDTACAGEGDFVARCEWHGQAGQTYDLVVLNRGAYLMRVALSFNGVDAGVLPSGR